jgi:hypothetical protein
VPLVDHHRLLRLREEQGRGARDLAIGGDHVALELDHLFVEHLEALLEPVADGALGVAGARDLVGELATALADALELLAEHLAPGAQAGEHIGVARIAGERRRGARGGRRDDDGRGSGLRLRHEGVYGSAGPWFRGDGRVFGARPGIGRERLRGPDRRGHGLGRIRLGGRGAQRPQARQENGTPLCW